MVYPAITALTAGIIVILQMILMMICGKSRYKHEQGLGDKGQPELIARIRAHGNLAENAALILVLLALLEMAGTNPTFIALAGAAFVLGRIAHPIGLFKTAGASVPRAIGVGATAIIGIFGGIALIVLSVGKLMA